MEIDKLVVLFGGIGLAGFIYRYFLMYKEKVVSVSGNVVKIVVNGGYSPGVVEVKRDQDIVLQFERKDPSSCLEEVVLPDFGKRVYLPLDQKTEVRIHPEKSGEFVYSCGMNMFHGRIIVK